MRYSQSVITLSTHATTALMEAVQRTIADKGASRATRKAAVSALLALVDAGLMKGSTFISAPVRCEAPAAEAHGKKWLLANHQGQS